MFKWRIILHRFLKIALHFYFSQTTVFGLYFVNWEKRENIKFANLWDKRGNRMLRQSARGRTHPPGTYTRNFNRELTEKEVNGGEGRKIVLLNLPTLHLLHFRVKSELHEKKEIWSGTPPFFYYKIHPTLLQPQLFFWKTLEIFVGASEDQRKVFTFFDL